MIEPKEVVIDGKNFILSKVPAVAGREIFSQYLTSAAPKIGSYDLNKVLMQKLLSYVAVSAGEGAPNLKLINDDLINNHVPSWEMLLKLEAAMIEYNCSFFQNGRVSTFLQDVAQKLPAWITKTLTDSLQQLFQTEKPPSMN